DALRDRTRSGSDARAHRPAASPVPRARTADRIARAGQDPGLLAVPRPGQAGRPPRSSGAPAMRRALVILFVWIAALAGGPVSARRDHALRHPSIQEVLLMTKGGVARDVVIERVRRLED